MTKKVKIKDKNLPFYQTKNFYLIDRKKLQKIKKKFIILYTVICITKFPFILHLCIRKKH